jgi:hypothetical protein
MKGRSHVVLEELGYELNEASAAVFYYTVYEYILYNDSDLFLEIIDYGSTIQNTPPALNENYIFKFLLRIMRKRHPSKLEMLRPMLVYR